MSTKNKRQKKKIWAKELASSWSRKAHKALKLDKILKNETKLTD